MEHNLFWTRLLRADRDAVRKRRCPYDANAASRGARDSEPEQPGASGKEIHAPVKQLVRRMLSNVNNKRKNVCVCAVRMGAAMHAMQLGQDSPDDILD